MTKTTPTRTWVRAVNGAAALALFVLLIVIYLPALGAFDVYRADLGYQGEWVGGHASRITAVTPGGAVERAGLKPGDVLEFDPKRDDDWVLAGYRQMPEGFGGSLPVRHADGTRSIVALAPARAAFLPTFGHQATWVIRMLTAALFSALAVFLVWARPGLMTWSLMFWGLAGWPARLFVEGVLASEAASHPLVLRYLLPVTWSCIPLALPFAATFPRGASIARASWKAAIAAAVWVAWLVYLCRAFSYTPFERELLPRDASITWAAVSVSTNAIAILLLVWNYRRSEPATRARLRWAILGMSTGLALGALFITQIVAFYTSVTSLGLSAFVNAQWVFIASALVWVSSFGYALLRQRVVDIQFAISRTVVYGIVSTVVLVFLAVLHWLLGRMIEHSRLAFGLEGLAAVGLGLVLHRATHGINRLVDRVLFRKHHAAEERLRQVTAALPFASTERSIGDALVIEPARNLLLASAALFYRDTQEGPLRRVRSEGWSEEHAASLDAESLLIRYLHAEHTATRLDDEQQWLPPGMPEGTAQPVLAIPIVSQHSLSAVVLYGSHLNGTLPDPDEVELLAALAKAAAVSHQQVRIATLMRENASLARETEAQQKIIDRFEAALARAPATLGQQA